MPWIAYTPRPGAATTLAKRLRDSGIKRVVIEGDLVYALIGKAHGSMWRRGADFDGLVERAQPCAPPKLWMREENQQLLAELHHQSLRGRRPDYEGVAARLGTTPNAVQVALSVWRKKHRVPVPKPQPRPQPPQPVPTQPKSWADYTRGLSASHLRLAEKVMLEGRADRRVRLFPSELTLNGDHRYAIRRLAKYGLFTITSESAGRDIPYDLVVNEEALRAYEAAHLPASPAPGPPASPPTPPTPPPPMADVRVTAVIEGMPSRGFQEIYARLQEFAPQILREPKIRLTVEA